MTKASGGEGIGKSLIHSLPQPYDDGSGESHFSLDIVSPVFAGQSRVARQRMVNHALGDLLRHSVHALAIKARAPGE